MKHRLSTGDPAGWYECRFLRNPPGTRVARYWDGRFLHHTPGTPVDGGVSNVTIDDREYTEFVALAPAEKLCDEVLDKERSQ